VTAVAVVAALAAASGSSSVRISEMNARSVMSTVVAKMPRTGVGDHEAIALELLQRLSHWSSTRAEVLRQCIVTERLTRPDVEHDETVPDGLVCPVAEGRPM
jgi:hypothetical protein